MCVVSMVGDHYADKYRRIDIVPYQPNIWPFVTPPKGGPNREEFEALKRDVEEMKALLKRAKEYDERNGEPNCETDEKMALLRKLAEAVGISLDDVIGKAP